MEIRKPDLCCIKRKLLTLKPVKRKGKEKRRKEGRGGGRGEGKERGGCYRF